MTNFIKSLWQKFLNNKKIKIFTIIFLICYILVICLTTIKVNKEIITPGVLNDPSHFLTIGSEEEGIYEKGNINTIGVYVTYQPTIFEYLISLPQKGFNISDYNPSVDLSARDNTLRSTYLKDISIDYALITAYEKAKLKNPAIDIDYQVDGILVTAVLPSSSNKDIKIGDLIVGAIVDGDATYISEFSSDHLQNFVNLLAEKEDFVLIIEDNDSTKNIECSRTNGGMGLELYVKYKINSSSPSYTIDQDSVHQSIGSSGGMMLALTIYNGLFEEDITKGLMICGTGTINLDGSVGAIGGIAQKIATAQLYKADVFFCPYSDDPNDESIISNYNEALSAYQLIDRPTFELVKISSLDDVLDYLESVGDE